ncbi:MAG: DUF1573 domain-containing protein [Bacteroidales bacterium]|nr:DUF1573 domain-containing protein [Bacteroidales bacterium]
MRNVVYYLSVLLCFALSIRLSAQTAIDNGPDILFEAKSIDYGDTIYKADSTYVYRFIYENTGLSALIVNKVVGHCPCVTIDYSTEPLPSGGRDTVTVYFKPVHASKYTQRITVFNNSSHSVVTLFAKANFLKPSDPKLTAKLDQDE